MTLPLSSLFQHRCLSLLPPHEPESILIFLHGLSQNPYSYFRMFTTQSLTFMPEKSKIMLPQSPRYHVKAYNNLFVPAWFDFWDGSKVNEDHIKSNSERVCKMLMQQRNLHPKIPLFIGGFSQGAALCGKIAEQSELVKGVFAFSGFMYRGLDKKKVNRAKWMICHGDQDDQINQPKAMKTFEKILERPVIKIVKGLGHAIDQEELDEARAICKKWILEK